VRVASRNLRDRILERWDWSQSTWVYWLQL